MRRKNQQQLTAFDCRMNRQFGVCTYRDSFFFDTKEEMLDWLRRQHDYLWVTLYDNNGMELAPVEVAQRQSALFHIL